LRIMSLALCGIVAALGSVSTPNDALDQGYNSMYNLDFNAAHQAFGEWEKAHPEDPFGPASDAAAYLFFEFDRLKVLRSEFLTDNHSFLTEHKLNADPAVKAAFESNLRKSGTLLEAMNKKGQPSDRALLSSVICTALHADYLALIEKNNWQALKEIKQARTLAESLVAKHPEYKDAYLPLGVENYILSQKPGPVRLLLRVTGSQTDKDAGLQKLRIVADGGYYFKPYAKILLAIAAARDQNKPLAKSFLVDLAAQFPRNELFRDEANKMSCPGAGC
jgi:hypothetical protein